MSRSLCKTLNCIWEFQKTMKSSPESVALTKKKKSRNFDNSLLDDEDGVANDDDSEILPPQSLCCSILKTPKSVFQLPKIQTRPSTRTFSPRSLLTWDSDASWNNKPKSCLYVFDVIRMDSLLVNHAQNTLWMIRIQQ